MGLVRLAIYYCIEIIELLIIIRCILSWFPMNRNRFIELIYSLTDPILDPIRKLTYKTFGGNMMIDFSPIIAFLLLSLIQRII